MLKYSVIEGGKRMEFISSNIEELALRVYKHRSRNSGYTLDQARADVVHQLKFSGQKDVTPAHLIKPKNEKLAVPKRNKISLHDAFKAANAFLKLVKDDIVSQAEIDRRTRICLSCPKLEMASNCMACGGSRIATNLLNAAKRALGSDIQFDRAIKTRYCGVCGCSLSLLIPTKLQHFKKDTPDKAASRPNICWAKSR